MKPHRKRLLGGTGALGLSMLCLAAVSYAAPVQASAAAPTGAKAAAAKGSIKVAAISSVTGPSSYAGWQLGAKVYFDEVNRQGGINGHKIDFKIFDDAGNPTNDTQIAHEEVDAGVVGFAGGVSADDCPVNGAYYDKVGIAVINVGNDPTCYTNPDIDPVNSGPQTDAELQMVYAAEKLHFKKICALTIALPGGTASEQAAIDGFEKITGLKILDWVKNFPLTANPAPAVLNLEHAGCQAVTLSVLPAQGLPIMKDAAAQGIHNITWLSGLGLYDPAFLKSAGSAADGMYIGLEFAPATSSQPAVKQMVAAFKADKVAFSGEEESSYVAAWIFGHVLSTIKGSITRATVLHAFKTLKPLDVPFMGTPFTFGSATKHRTNEASFWTRIEKGAFNPVKPASWYVLPGFVVPKS